MAWRRLGNKPSSEFNDAYMRHLAPTTYTVTTYQHLIFSIIVKSMMDHKHQKWYSVSKYNWGGGY